MRAKHTTSQLALTGEQKQALPSGSDLRASPFLFPDLPNGDVIIWWSLGLGESGYTVGTQKFNMLLF